MAALSPSSPCCTIRIVSVHLLVAEASAQLSHSATIPLGLSPAHAARAAAAAARHCWDQLLQEAEPVTGRLQQLNDRLS